MAESEAQPSQPAVFPATAYYAIFAQLLSERPCFYGGQAYSTRCYDESELLTHYPRACSMPCFFAQRVVEFGC